MHTIAMFEIVMGMQDGCKAHFVVNPYVFCISFYFKRKDENALSIKFNPNF